METLYALLLKTAKKKPADEPKKGTLARPTAEMDHPWHPQALVAEGSSVAMALNNRLVDVYVGSSWF